MSDGKGMPSSVGLQDEDGEPEYFANGVVNDDEAVTHPAGYRFVPDRLCSVCSTILAKSEVLNLIGENIQPKEPVIEIWPHHVDKKSLTESRGRGCHLCCLLWAQTGETLVYFTGLKDAGLPDGPLYLYLSTRSNNKIHHPRGHPRFHFEFGLGRPNQEDGKVRPHEPLLLERELPNTQTFSDSFLDSAIGSDAVFDAASGWLKTCLSKHTHCSNRANFLEYLPRRLLKISGSKPDFEVQLVEITDDYPRDLAYLTLSHRWGANSVTRLQRSNCAEFLKSIPFKSLPHTFQDAVTVTLRLGYGYLWIDAMCIVQDDDDDLSEALNMSYIYGNSICTISALNPADSTKPSLYSRAPLNYLPCKVRTASGKILTFVSWRAKQVLFYSGADSDRSTLHRRAWVVQERLLTPRNLYFSICEASWQCSESNCSETNNDDRSKSGAPFLRAQLRRSTRAVAPVREPAQFKTVFLRKMEGKVEDIAHINDWHEEWWRLIEDSYTSAQISRPEDRWPAISGIARTIEYVTGVRMLAGLWSSHMMVDLLWSIDDAGGRHNTQRLSQRIDNGQPTWSWLSVSGRVYQQPIEWPETLADDTRFAGRIVAMPEEYDRQKSGLSPSAAESVNLPYYMAVQPQCIVVEGPMLKFPAIKKSKVPYEEREEIPYIKPAQPLSEIVIDFLQVGYSYWQRDYDYPLEDLEDAWVLQWTRQELWRSESSWHMLPRHKDKHISGFIVKPLDSEQTRWTRIGRFRISYTGKKGKPIGPMRTISLY